MEGDCVYALSPGGNLVCVQAADGKEVWRKHMKNDFHVGKAYPGFGYSESVLVAGDKLFCIPGGPDGAVMALNKMTGELVWRTKDLTDTSCYCSLVMANIGAVPQLLACTASHLSGIAPDSGKILWSVDKSSPTQVVPTPRWKDDCVFTSDGAVGCNLVKITHSGADFKAEQVYANKKSVLARLAGGVLVGQDIYGCVDGWTCMDFLTGKVIWSDKQKLGGGTLTYAEGHLYLRTGGKGPCTLALIEASPSGWKETGRFEQPDRSAKAPFAHLVISNGKLFVRDQDILLCYDIKQK